MLANEEVVDGVSERGSYPVVRKPLRQWQLRITAYADRLMLLEPSGGEPNVPGLVGIPAKEPAFGLPAIWVLPVDRSRAEASGLTVAELQAVYRDNAFVLIPSLKG